MSEIEQANDTPSSSPPKKKRSWKWRLVRWFLYLLLFIVSLPVGLIVGWQFDVIRKPLVQFGLSFAGVALEGKVELGDLGGTLVSSIVVDNFRWKDRNGRLMVSLNRLEAHYDLMHFLSKGELLIKKVLIDKPYASVGMAHYGFKPGPNGTTILRRLQAKTPAELRQALTQYAQVETMLDLQTHIKPTIPRFCKQSPGAKVSSCGEGYLCIPFKKQVTESFRAWTGTCAAKPPPKPKTPPAPSTFKLRVGTIVLKGLGAVFSPGPGAKAITAKDMGLKANFVMDGPVMKAVLSGFQVKVQNPNVNITELGLRFWMKGKKLKASDIVLKLAGGSEIRVDAGLHLLPILGVDAQLKKIFVTAKDMKGIVPVWPIKPDISLSGSATGSLADIKANILGNIGKLGINIKAQSSVVGQTYDAKIGLSNIDLSDFMGKKDLKSHVDLTLTAKGKGFSDATNGDVSLRVKKGYFQQYQFDSVALDAALRNRNITLNKLDVKTPYGKLGVGGEVHIGKQTLNVKVNGFFPRLDRVGRLFKQRMSGLVTLNARVVGKKFMPGLGTTATVVIKNFRHPAARLKRAQVGVSLRSLQPTIEAGVALDAFGIRAGGQYVRKFLLSMGFKLAGPQVGVRLKRMTFNIGSGDYRLEKTGWIKGRKRQLQPYLGFHIKKMLAKVKHLWLRRYRETIRVDGWIDVKKWVQDLRVRINQLDLGAIRRALRIMPKSKLAGKVGVDLAFRGSFFRPQLGLVVSARGVRFQQFKNLTADVAVDYGIRRFARFQRDGSLQMERHFPRQKRRNVQRLNLRVDAAMGRTRLVDVNVSLPVGVAIRGGLRPPLIVKNPAVRIDLDRPLLVDVKVPSLVLQRFRNVIKQPVGGTFDLQLKVWRKLRDPRLSLGLKLRDVSWKQISWKKIKVGSSVRRVKQTGIAIKHVDATFDFQYSRGKLLFHPRSNWLRHDKQELFNLSGRLPLFFNVGTRRRKLTTSFGLVAGQPMDFQLNVIRRRLRDFWRFLPASTKKIVGHFRGLFEASIKLGGQPLSPKVDVHLGLTKASLCPLEKGKFRCFKQTYGGRRRGTKPRSLRIHNVDFRFDVNYRPPPRSSVTLGRKSVSFKQAGNLQIASALRVGKTLLMEMRRKLKTRSSQADTGIPLAFAIHPTRLTPSFRLFVKEPIAFQLRVPGLNISSGKTFCQNKRRVRRSNAPSIVDFVRLPILRRLKGQISLDLLLRNHLGAPRLNFDFRLRKGGYLFDCASDGKAMWIDGLKTSVGLAVNRGIAMATVRADVLNRPIFRMLSQIEVKAGLKAVPNRKTGAVSYKTDVVLGKKLTANMLFCRFQLDRLGKIGGVFKMLTGTLQGQIELSGDPACPVFRSIPASRRINPLLKPGKQPCRFVQKTSHLLLTDLVLGNKPKPKKRRGFGRRKKKSTAFLHISKLRFDMKSIEKGRFRLQLSGKRAACVRHKFKPSGAAGRAKLKRLLAVSKRECPHKSVTPPRRAGFPWWMWRLKRTSSLLSLDVKSPFPSLAGKLKPADARRRCPHWKGSAPLKDLYVNFSSPGIPLEFVESFVSGLKLKAYFGANVLLEGKGNNPPVIRRGQVNIDLKDMRYPAYGVRLLSGVSNGRKRRSYVRLLLAPTSYKVRGQLEGVNGTPFKILGKITHKNFVPQSYDIRLRAKSFKPMDTIKYKLTLRTNIDIKKSAKANAPMWVRGRVEIPRMLFTLPDSSGGPSTYNEDGDIIVLGEPSEKRLRPKKVAVERPKSSGSPLFIDLKIKIPRNFVVRNRDLQVEAKTDQDQDLGVTMGNGSLKLSGGIEIVRGELSQFGKRFSVQTGSRVSFTGQSMPLSQIGSRIDPRLQIAAVYVLKPAKGSSLEKKGHKKVKVFLIVSGSLQKLKVDFEVRDAFSGTKIDLDKVNVIALLLTGSTTDDLSSGQQKNLTNQAFGMLGRAIASELRNQLSSVVPLDVLNIETGTRAEDLKVDVGWYLNPSVYFQLSVKPVPLDEESYWEALVDWSINRQLSLEARAGQMKRNDSPLFRGSAYFYYRLKY